MRLPLVSVVVVFSGDSLSVVPVLDLLAGEVLGSFCARVLPAGEFSGVGDVSAGF